MATLRRNSRQRMLVYDAVKASHEHPNAEEVYQVVKQRLPDISLGTVYRNLNLLEEMGQLRRIHTGIGGDRFDAVITAHPHLICTRCGGVFDLNLDISQLLQSAKGVEGSFQVEDCKVLVQGVCEDCLKKEE